MTDQYVTIRRELLERIDDSAICDGTDVTISNDLFIELVAALAAPVQEPMKPAAAQSSEQPQSSPSCNPQPPSHLLPAMAGRSSYGS